MSRAIALAKLAKARELSRQVDELMGEAIRELEAGEAPADPITDDERVEMRKLFRKKGIACRPERVRRVYFIRAESGGPIKIGTAMDVVLRCSNLQMGRHDRLHIIASMVGGFKEEKALHRQFAALHISGEWFRDAPVLMAFISGLRP